MENEELLKYIRQFDIKKRYSVISESEPNLYYIYDLKSDKFICKCDNYYIANNIVKHLYLSGNPKQYNKNENQNLYSTFYHWF